MEVRVPKSPSFIPNELPDVLVRDATLGQVVSEPLQVGESCLTVDSRVSSHGGAGIWMLPVPNPALVDRQNRRMHGNLRVEVRVFVHLIDSDDTFSESANLFEYVAFDHEVGRVRQ